jgi:EAL domain-containing protein (putative c-di-GMP-specific phosphodiesterase class I)
MSSVLKTPAGSAGIGELPFASYAQIIRMLVPPAERISFYDVRGNALWINDGVDEPEFRMHVELVIARARQSAAPHGPAPMFDHDDSAHVFPIRNNAGAVVGAVGIACRNLANGARYRSAEAVERIIAPVMNILGHAWPVTAESAPMANAPRETAGTRQAAVAASQLQASMPVPALLRKTLSVATDLIDCAFGGVVLPDRPFTLSLGVSPDESDLAITAAIDNVREHVLKWMKARNEPLVANSTGRGQLPHKLLVVPIRDASKRPVALLMLFRSVKARDFAGVDVDELTQLAARIPTEALAALAPPEPPVIASVVKLPPAAPTVATGPAAKPQAAPKPAAPVPPARPTVAVQPAAVAPKPAPAPAKPAAPRVTTDAPRIVVPTTVSAAASTISMDERVRSALREGSFDLYAQKIAPMGNTPESPRFEVLVRMRDAGKLHGPTSFFAAAESSRLLPDLDCWVIGELLRTLRKRAVTVRASSLEFSINLAGQSLATDQFAEFIVAEVCRTAIPAGLLVFEISERTALEHEDEMGMLSARLRDVGCRIALDNCRSGLGTLDPANRWPVSRVKIDGSLIRNIGVSSRSESQVRAVAQLAADRGIETVAECVENERIHEKLLNMGIDFAQGFHFARPQPLSTLFG